MMPKDEREPQFPIGTKFTPRGKNRSECEVVDILRTYNAKGEQVKLRYVCRYPFLGQDVYNYDIVETTIKMALMNEI